MPPRIDVDAAAATSFVLVDRLPAGTDTDWHAHVRHQLLFASSGQMHLETADAQWLLPPQQAAWIPAGVRHRVRVRATADLCTAYLGPPTPDLAGGACVFAVPPVVSAMLEHAVRWDPRRRHGDEADRFFAVLVDVCRDAVRRGRPWFLPTARTPELARAMAHVLARPGAPHTVAAAARVAAVSPRTLARRFAAEAHMSFETFVRAARLLRAMSRLLEPGAQVTEVGHEVGFTSPAAFSRAFASFVGEPPSAWRRRHAAVPEPGA
ncbi:helix-turn-helix transcriptional regulator [Nannocystis sp. SCPEA4]|uniref:AraC family transcriptional regulator n=1 Tax=Nannocystis sp. SCPEA4 TaxID=2996787 RepID=UPI00227069D9|nr:helix-turn-helix transcriptional regulator [Nannocystis sp. SCPEA4]MCY1059513.1 helix-turn-helix transcriptional regulator [Nannocystis sp. SCPEA4]